MTLDNEQLVRKAYQIAEDKDMAGWSAAFSVDGTFTDESIGVTWTGPDELPEQLQGSHLGPLHLPAGILPPTGRRLADLRPQGQTAAQLDVR
jgi:hypothetical protein